MSEANTYGPPGVQDDVDQIISEAQAAFEHMDEVKADRLARLDEVLHLVEDMRDHMAEQQRDLAAAARNASSLQQNVASLQARVSDGDRRESDHKERILDGERRLLEVQHQLTDARRANAALEKDRADVEHELDDLRGQHVRLVHHFREFLHALGERNRLIQPEEARFDAVRQLTRSLALYGGAGQDEARRIAEADAREPSGPGPQAAPPQPATQPAPQPPARVGATVRLVAVDDGSRDVGERA